jgi:hypothetical protein
MRMEPLVVNVEGIHRWSAGARGASALARREYSPGLSARKGKEPNPSLPCCCSILGPCVQPCLALARVTSSEGTVH